MFLGEGFFLTLLILRLLGLVTKTGVGSCSVAICTTFSNSSSSRYPFRYSALNLNMSKKSFRNLPPSSKVFVPQLSNIWIWYYQALFLFPIGSHLVPSGPIGSHWVPFGPLWSHLVLFGPIWFLLVPVIAKVFRLKSISSLVCHVVPIHLAWLL